MTTNASASVIYSGIKNVAAGPIASATATGQVYNSYKQVIVKKTGGVPVGTLSLCPYQKFVTGGFLDGYANLKGFANGAVLITNGNFKIKKFASGDLISSLVGGIWEGGTNHIASEQKGPGTNAHSSWAPSQTGFAVFRLSTVGHSLDYGWIRLSFDLGSNRAANSITVKDWAINTASGDPIRAGEGIPSSVPEPSTGGLALLAAGAMGVLALRRRRQAAQQPHFRFLPRLQGGNAPDHEFP